MGTPHVAGLQERRSTQLPTDRLSQRPQLRRRHRRRLQSLGVRRIVMYRRRFRRRYGHRAESRAESSCRAQRTRRLRLAHQRRCPRRNPRVAGRCRPSPGTSGALHHPTRHTSPALSPSPSRSCRRPRAPRTVPDPNRSGHPPPRQGIGHPAGQSMEALTPCPSFQFRALDPGVVWLTHDRASTRDDVNRPDTVVAAPPVRSDGCPGHSGFAPGEAEAHDLERKRPDRTSTFVIGSMRDESLHMLGGRQSQLPKQGLRNARHSKSKIPLCRALDEGRSARQGASGSQAKHLHAPAERAGSTAQSAATYQWPE